METDPLVRFLLGAGIALGVLLAGWIVFRIGQGKEAPAPVALSDWPGPPKDPTELKPVLEFTLIAESARLIEPEPPRERREFRFRGYDHFRDEEVYCWYRRNAETGEVIGTHSVPVRVFWNQCYDM